MLEYRDRWREFLLDLAGARLADDRVVIQGIEMFFA
jgi:hypothetical protein